MTTELSATTDKGGFFTGIEMPYDNSRIDGGALALGYAPSLKVAPA